MRKRFSDPACVSSLAMSGTRTASLKLLFVDTDFVFTPPP